MQPTKLNLFSLEQRDVPATFGIPWQEGSQLTLSFVPDGTLVGTQASTLNVMMGPNTTEWQGEILRAFQTWAVQSNINIGLVSDDGSSLSAGGSVQGNARFGDIRIAGVALASDVYAITAPPDMYTAWSGTILINTNKLLNIGGTNKAADLYTIMMQEAGHALGVGNSPSTSSVMYEYYSGVRAGISAEDIISIQSLYGVRGADQYDHTVNNGSHKTATNLPSTGAEADITTTSDADWYRFTASNTSLTVKLDVSGGSLLNAIVRVTDVNGNVIATGQSVNAFNNSVQINLTNLAQGSTYFVQVVSARTDAFGIGSYRLRVGTASTLASQDEQADYWDNFVYTEQVSNDTIESATSLFNPEKTVSNQTDYIFGGRYNKLNDVDFFSVTAPALGTATTESLVVSVWGVNGAIIDPSLKVYDANGNALQFTVMNQTATSCVIQVTNIIPGAKYFIRNASQLGLLGTYRMAINFIDTTLPAPTMAMGGSLANLTSKALGSFSLAQSSYVHLTLSSFGAPSLTGNLTLTIYDSANKIVAIFLSGPNDNQSLDLFLKGGNYRFVVTTTSLSTINYSLGLYVTTDPVAMTPTSSSSSAPPPSSSAPPHPPSSSPSSPPPPSSSPSSPPPPSSSKTESSMWWSSPSPSYRGSSKTSTSPTY